MARDREFHDYVMHDAFSGLGGITSRPMFGGYGIYKNGVFFALIAEGELYFKVDDINLKFFEELSSAPFVYESRGKSMTMSYWKLPEEIMENKIELPIWIERSVSAALRKGDKDGRRKRKTRS